MLIPAEPCAYRVTYPGNVQFTVATGDTVARLQRGRSRSTTSDGGVRCDEELVSVSCVALPLDSTSLCWAVALLQQRAVFTVQPEC